MYVYRVLVCDLLNAPETYFVVLQVCLHLFVYGVQHLEYRTGCLRLSVAFPTGDYKSGLTVHSAYILAMCGKFNGCCYVYDVQHLEYHTGCNSLKPSLPISIMES